MNELYHRVQAQLPLIREGKVSPEEMESLISEIKFLMKATPELGKELGPLIPAINKAKASRVIPPQLNWVPVDGGFLAIGHKPGGRISFPGLKAAGTTAVLSLLMEREGARAIGQGLEKSGMEWLWFPFSAVRPAEDDQVLALFLKMKAILEKQGRIYIHCSAGIHRTGMVTYAFLRYLGLDPEQAMNRLYSLRKVTAEGATEKRLAWGDGFGNERLKD